MPEVQATRGGCYQIATVISSGGHPDVEAYGWSRTAGNKYRCNACHAEWSDRDPAPSCSANPPTYGYKCSHGYTNGQVISATIMY